MYLIYYGDVDSPTLAPNSIFFENKKYTLRKIYLWVSRTRNTFIDHIVELYFVPIFLYNIFKYQSLFSY